MVDALSVDESYARLVPHGVPLLILFGRSPHARSFVGVTQKEYNLLLPAHWLDKLLDEVTLKIFPPAVYSSTSR